MKKILASAVFVCILVVSFSANAETHRRFRRQTLRHLIATPVYFLLNLNIHEGSHAFAAAMDPKIRVDSYQPYPHFINNEDGTRDFVIGSFSSSWDRDRPPSNSCLAYIHLSPYVADMSIFVITDLLLSAGIIDPRSPFGGMMFIVGMAGTMIDFLFNMIGSANQFNDIAYAAELLGTNTAVFTTIGVFVLSVALWRVIRMGINVFTDRVDGPSRRRYIGWRQMI